MLQLNFWCLNSNGITTNPRQIHWIIALASLYKSDPWEHTINDMQTTWSSENADLRKQINFLVLFRCFRWRFLEYYNPVECTCFIIATYFCSSCYFWWCWWVIHAFCSDAKWKNCVECAPLLSVGTMILSFYYFFSSQFFTMICTEYIISICFFTHPRCVEMLFFPRFVCFFMEWDIEYASSVYVMSIVQIIFSLIA